MLVQSNDDLLSFVLSVDNENTFLPSMEDYINSLNEYDTAYCPINKNGVITNADVKGIIAESTPETFRMIPGLEFSPIIYRGLNNDYVFMPDSQRYELFDAKERVRHSINWIKKHEFLSLISRTPYYTVPKTFNVLNYGFEHNWEAISKHYGYMSDYIDVTRNIMVAYFYAYTYYDAENNKMQPLENFDINTPILYAGSLKDLYRKAPRSIKNISWQPLLRPMAQQALSIDTSVDREMIQGIFRKIELPKNPKIARYVYDLFEGGNLLYPMDYISRCAASVKNNKTLYEDLLNRYCEETKTDIIWLRKELTDMEYEFVDEPWNIPEQAKDVINKEYEDKIIPYMKTNFIFRGVEKVNI